MEKKVTIIPMSLYFVFLIILLNSGYMLSISKPALPTLLLGITAIWLFFKAYKGVKRLQMVSGIVAVGLSFCTVLSMLVNYDIENFKTYFQIVIYIFAAVSIVRVYNFRKFAIVYLLYIRIIAIISLIFYVIINFSGLTLTFLPIEVNSAGTMFFNTYVFFSFIGIPQRNCGVFWEPGMYQGILIIACLLTLKFTKSKQKIFDLILFSVTVLTTQSTTGFFLLAFIVLLIIVKNYNGAKGAMVTFFGLIVLMVAIYFQAGIIRFLASALPDVFGKLLTSNQSLTDRTIMPLVDMGIALQYPFSGAGISNQFILAGEFANQLGFQIKSQTSTITTFASTFGLFFAGVYVFAWLKGIFRQKLNRNIKFVLTAIIVVLLSTEIHNYVFLTYCFMFYLLNSDMNEHETL